jgi:hypothetical protein
VEEEQVVEADEPGFVGPATEWFDGKFSILTKIDR